MQPKASFQSTIERSLPYPAHQVVIDEGLVIALIDPEAYVGDANYRARRRNGMPALRNLWAFDQSSRKLWEAELPEAVDYYVEITTLSPLTVKSFSGYTCEIDPANGRIVRHTYHK